MNSATYGPRIDPMRPMPSAAPDARRTQHGRIVRGGHRVVAGLAAENSESRQKHHDEQHRHRQTRLTDQRDHHAGAGKAGDQHAEEPPLVDRPGNGDRADGAAGLEHRPDHERGRRRQTHAARDRRQPRRQHVQIDQVHELHRPQQHGAGGAAFMEERDDRHAFLLLFVHDELRVPRHLERRLDALQPSPDFVEALLAQREKLQRLRQRRRTSAGR